MIEKRCTTVRDHKPHLWSRTTRKTVTEETAGDTLQCPGKAKPTPPVDRDAWIRRSIEEGRGKSMFADPTPAMNRLHGPMCRCGVPRKPPGISRYQDDDGLCTVHPDRPPQPWVRGAGNGT